MWDLPGPGFESASPALAGGLFTTREVSGFLYFWLTSYKSRFPKPFPWLHNLLEWLIGLRETLTVTGFIMGFPVCSVVKNPPAMQKMWIWSLGWEDLLEKEMATCSRILAQEILWTEEPGRLLSMGSQSVRHNLATKQHLVYYKENSSGTTQWKRCTEQRTEKVHRASMPHPGKLPSQHLICSPTQKLSRPCYLGVLTEALLCGNNWLNHWPLAIKRLGVLGWENNSKHLITWFIPLVTNPSGITH